MRKLEEIPKKDIFKVPEGYFDALPSQIRARIDAEKPLEWYQQPRLRWALVSFTVLLIALFSILQFPGQKDEIQEQLSSIQREDLIEYLQESNLSMVEITAEVPVDDEVYQEILDKNLMFDAADFEDEILMNLEKYSDEIL